ncbi:helix-turn-helix domain-containing protein [Actinokineospora sp. 24-640]
MVVTRGVTPRNKALGEALRKAREDGKLGLRELARRLDMDHSLLSRFESGQRTPRTEDVASILTAIGVTGPVREELMDFAREPERAQWLGVGMTEQQRQLATLLDYERQAASIINVSPLLVPGLLQTSDYARAIMRSGRVPEGEIETRVAVRLGRRDTLTRRDPARLLALIGEQVLLQRIGGPAVMAEQVHHLAEAAQASNIDIRVLPLDCAWHPGLEGPWKLVEPREDSDLSPVVHLESRRSGVFLHRSQDVDAYSEGVERVLSEALTSAESAEVIAREADRWKRELNGMEEVEP